MRNSWLYLATRSERAGAPVIDLPDAGGDHEIGDQRIFGFLAVMRVRALSLPACGHVRAFRRLPVTRMP